MNSILMLDMLFDSTLKGVDRDSFLLTLALFYRYLSESLILAQNERWRQASYMQVER